jgi:2,4-diketo-3-deoxy-L-fuconate hydrolase
MRLIQFGPHNHEKPGIVDAAGRRRDASAHFLQWNAEFFANNGLSRLHKLLDTSGDTLPIIPEDVRWGAPIARPGKVICIGLNYSDHAAESGMAIPEEPILFLKASNAVVGPYDDVLIPRGSFKTDWEVELGVIIGTEARYLESLESAADCIAGYAISHDVSERAFQLERGGQWTKGKSCDTFNPLGPWLSTADDIPRPDSLGMRLWVNGTERQHGSTSTMVFSAPILVLYLSQFMTLEPGDLISTGTPPGVGLGMKPPQYLSEGDVVELEIEHLGRQRQRFIPA